MYKTKETWCCKCWRLLSPLKLSIESGQYLDGRPPGKSMLVEVLVRPAGGAHLVVCLGPNTPENGKPKTFALFQNMQHL